MRTKWMWLAIVAAAAALAGGAITTTLASSNPAPASSGPRTAPERIQAGAEEEKAAPEEAVDAREMGEQDEEAEQDEDATGLKAAITPEQAKAAALAVQPGTVTEVELEKEGDVVQYAVDITSADGTKYDVEVDATSGKVLKSVVDDEASEKDEDDDHDNAPVKAAITPEQAKAAALHAQPGTVKEVELEDEDGVTVYEVDITAADGKAFEVTVDASTGKVLKSEPDDEQEPEGNEGKGEKD